LKKGTVLEDSLPRSSAVVILGAKGQVNIRDEKRKPRTVANIFRGLLIFAMDY
jgi:hypothetical protein